MRPLELEEALEAIGELKRTLMAKGEASELFGQLRGEGLASALATIEQGFGEELFYPNVASHRQVGGCLSCHLGGGIG